MGFASLPLVQQASVGSQQFENGLRNMSRHLPIHRASSLGTFFLQSGELSKAKTNFEDTLGSQTRYRSIMLTIATS
jgi:hypothetical protein